MTLLDSNIMIDYFRDRSSDFAAKVDSMEAAVCGAVKAEVLHGAKTDREIDDMLEAFNTFDHLPNDDYDWEGTGFVLQTLRSHGIQVPLPDALIAFTAMKYDVPLWTKDEHFKLIQGCYPELRLYEEAAGL